jgi:hypothetical protein
MEAHNLTMLGLHKPTLATLETFQGVPDSVNEMPNQTRMWWWRLPEFFQLVSVKN